MPATITDLDEFAQRDAINQERGKVAELERQVAILREQLAEAKQIVQEFHTIKRHRDELFDWTLDQVSDEHGPDSGISFGKDVDSTLETEEWLPGRYRKNGMTLQLVSAVYRMEE